MLEPAACDSTPAGEESDQSSHDEVAAESIAQGDSHEPLKPLDKDILLGRGRPYHDFPGNIRMLDIVARNKSEYANLPRDKKRQFAANVLHEVLNEGARFLRRCETAGGEEYWQRVDEASAFGKVWHALRDKSDLDEKPSKRKKTLADGEFLRALSHDLDFDSSTGALGAAGPSGDLQSLELLAKDLWVHLSNAAAVTNQLVAGLRAAQQRSGRQEPQVQSTEENPAPTRPSMAGLPIDTTESAMATFQRRELDVALTAAEEDSHPPFGSSLLGTPSPILARASSVVNESSAQSGLANPGLLSSTFPLGTLTVGSGNRTSSDDAFHPPSTQGQSGADPRHASIIESVTRYARSLQAREMAPPAEASP
jgi:hypothetical protein